MKKVAVILSGCGVYDGAEINEAVLTLLALQRAGAEVTCAAPNVAQKQVINHCTGEVMPGETRNAMVEAARITRGPIRALEDLNAKDVDALIFVGGFGAAKNLSNFAFDGPAYDADPVLIDLIQSAHAEGIPTAYMCIAPVLAALALGRHGVELTIGNDAGVVAALESKGARHIPCKVDEAVVDAKNRVVSTPAYMLANNLIEAEAGINQLVAETLRLTQ